MAIKHFDQGQAFFLARAYDKAAAEYQKAYDLVPKPGLLFNIGLCRENLGDRTGAIEMYRSYLAADPHGAKSVEARARLTAIEEAIASERRAAEERRAAAERRAAEERRAEQERRERALRAAGETEERERDRPRLYPGLLVLGGAAGAGAIGLAYQLRASSIRQDLDRELENGTPPLDSRDPRFDEGKSAALRSSIAYGIAAAAGAVGAGLTVRALLARRSSRAAISVHPSGAGLDVEVRW